MIPHLQTPLLVRLPLIGLVILLLLLLLLLLLFSPSLKVDALQAVAPIARPGCQDTCGNVTIPFPFGIGAKNCFLDSRYEIKCKEFADSKGSSWKPFLSKFNIEVMEITFPDSPYDEEIPIASGDSAEKQTVIAGIPSLNVCSANTQHFGIGLRGSPYNFSTQNNVFIMEGCPGSAVLIDQSNTVMAGCGTVCSNNNSVIFANKCHGVPCCQNPFPSESGMPLQSYQIGFYGQSSGNCLVATLIKSDSVDRYIGKLSTSHPPTVLLWSWISDTWPDSDPNAGCYRDETTNYTNCYCHGGHYGNPYVTNGCQVPEECKGCRRVCRRIMNAFYCYPNYPISSYVIPVVGIGLSVAMGPLLLVFGCCWFCRFLKRRKKTERRVKFFKLKLQQHQSASEGFVERTKLFTHKQMDKATNHFNEDRVLGKGGQGTVYKGMLSDGRIVAIKKSKLMDESQMEQFINELVILSQINHRHVVKLLGCCLETEVPLLVYEFISNGTLHQHIHDPSEDNILSWAMRLKIAADSAGAIAYLHSSSSTPIYHRDIKPSNILLDDKHRAKVSDFGSSKTIAMDQTHLTTLVQGTIGYLDPEYFESNTFTAKSDVYSFGVVLLELLTGKKTIYTSDTMEQKSLVTEFFFQMRNFGLSNILDPEVVKEAKEEQLMAVVDLAKHCLNESGRLRPTMKEVAMTLEMIIKFPAETCTRDQQAFPNEGFSEFVMREASDVEFMSSPYPVGASSPLYIDVQPLLHDTI